MNEFIEEIQEDLKKEQLLKFWKHYGNYVIGAGIALILGGAGYFYWDHSRSQYRQELTQAYEQALQETDPQAKSQAFEKLSSSTLKGYAALGAFEEAELSDNPSEAYRKIAQEARYEKTFRELATLKAISKDIAAGGDPHGLLDEITTLTKTASPWREVAYEMEGSLHLLAGNLDQAMAIFESLAGAESAPRGVRQRSQIMLGSVMQRTNP